MLDFVRKGRRPVLACLALLAAAGCADKIQLPPGYNRPGVTSIPVIQLQNLVLLGKVDKESIISDSTTAVMTVNVTPDTSDKDNPIARIGVFGSATDTVFGIRSFEIQVQTGPYVTSDVIVQQTPDAQNRVDPSLAITEDNPDGSGTNSLIEVFPTRDYDTIVTVTAINFGFFGLRRLDIHYVCPKCYSWDHLGAPQGTFGNTGGSNASPPRMPGSFAEVLPNAAFGKQSTHDGSVTATISAYPLGPQTDQVVLASGASTYTFPFSVGTLNASLAPVGGVGFSANSALAVVETFEQQQVTFYLAALPGIFTTRMSGKITVDEADPTAGGSPLSVRPRIFISPDATLAIVLGAPSAGTPASLYSLEAYDLSKGTATLIKRWGNASAAFGTAVVSGTQIVVTLQGGTQLTADIPT